MNLEGRVALVTGAGQGVGRGIAMGLAADGAAVVVGARRVETGEPVAAEIRWRGDKAICVQMDVTERASVEAAVAAAVDRFGGLHIVVHNAFHGSRPSPLEDVTLADWRPNSGTAVWAASHCAQAAFPALQKAGAAGRFIVVTSTAGFHGSADRPLYAAVKAAQRGLVEGLAREWGGHGITVNAIAPVAMTPSLEQAFRNSPLLEQRLLKQAALGRMGDPERDIAPVVAFLASDGGGYVTGQTIVCDGGRVIGPTA